MKGVERDALQVLPARVHRSSDVPPFGVLAADRVAEREQRRLYPDLLDFCRGNSLPHKTIENPIVAGTRTAEKALRANY